ncbi:MAG: hypothetical protein ACXVBF_10305, partial [Flavisolibacter sp.]
MFIHCKLSWNSFYSHSKVVSLQSILDNDFYKFTMQQGVLKLFPRAKARYQFINRGKHSFPAGFAEALRQSVDAMGSLKLN